MKKFQLFAFLFFICAAELAAQSGKIVGTVTDAETGDPLPGVNVIVVDTDLGAATGPDGQYTIMNVSPGNYGVRAQIIGYAAVLKEDVRVSIDLTTTIDFSMETEAIAGEEVIVTAAPPLIQPDISGSERNISTDEVMEGFYQSVEKVIDNQVGVKSTAVYDDAPQIRGDVLTRSVFIVDGISQGNAINNRPDYQINLQAVKEIKIETGGFSAEYGNVRSGVVNVVTKEGGEQYHGTLDYRYSPPAVRHFGPMYYGFDSPYSKPFVDPNSGAWDGVKNPFGFEGWNNWANNTQEPGQDHYGNPDEGYARWLWRHRSEEAMKELERLEQEGVIEWAPGFDPDEAWLHRYGYLPDTEFRGTFGGPVPLLPKTTFFISHDREFTEYVSGGPAAGYRDQNTRGKITFSHSNSLKIRATGYYSYKYGAGDRAGQELTSGASYRSGTDIETGWITNDPYGALLSEYHMWYPHTQAPSSQIRQIYALKLTHTLSDKTFYELDVSHHRNDFPVEMEWRDTKPIAGREGWTHLLQGRIGTEEEAEEMATTDPTWENWRDWRRIKVGDIWYDEAPYGYDPVNWKDVNNYLTMGSAAVHVNDTYQRSYEMKGTMTSQINFNHQIKAGFALRDDYTYMHRELIDPSVNGGNVYTSEPKDHYSGALFVQDKMEYEGFVANFGLRGDWSMSAPFPTRDGEGEDGPFSSLIAPGNDQDVEETMPTERVTKFALSPRLGISHPISTVAKIYFNYGHFYQWPNLYQNYIIRYFTPAQNRVYLMGNPNLDPEQTIQYEIGYEHNLFSALNLRLTGYYKDINDEIGSISYYPRDYGSYSTYDNNHYRDVRGLELFLELRRGSIPYFSGWTSVDYRIASGAEYGFDGFYEDPTRQPSYAETEVSDPDVRPIIKTSLNFGMPSGGGPTIGNISPLSGLSVNLIYVWERGIRFTWNPDGIPLVENNIRSRPYQRWDMRIRKPLFSWNALNSELYVDISNLFNNKNMTMPTSFSYTSSGVLRGVSGGERERWAWDGHPWWSTEFVDYMNSLDLTVNSDGSISGPDRPGDYPKGGDREYIDMPAFTPFTFLEKRDIHIGLVVNF